MLEYFLYQDAGNSEIILSGDETAEISRLADSRYRTWEWNYAYGPDYQFRKDFIIRGKPVSLTLTVKNGIIEECNIKGSEDLLGFAPKLTGCRHMPEDITSVFETEVILNDDELFDFF
jgi:lipoate-protein ligase A